MRYVAFLFAGGLSYPTILSSLAAVNFWCRSCNWPIVTQSHQVLSVLRGVQALSQRRPRRKFPITPDVLRSLCSTLSQVGISAYDEVALRAMFLLAFHAFLRVGEFCSSHHSLQLSDVALHSNHISITFRSFKFSQGRCPTVFVPVRDLDLCPVRALQAYLIRRVSGGSLLFLDESRRPYSTSSFRKLLRLIVSSVGLRDAGITPHSFHVGAAMTAAAVGIPVETIQCMRRWSSRALDRYIKFQINRV